MSTQEGHALAKPGNPNVCGECDEEVTDGGHGHRGWCGGAELPLIEAQGPAEKKETCKRETLSVTSDGICVDCGMPADQHEGPDPVQAHAVLDPWALSFGINATDEGRVTGLNVGAYDLNFPKGSTSRRILDLVFSRNVSRGTLEKIAMDLEGLAVNLRALAQRNHK